MKKFLQRFKWNNIIWIIFIVILFYIYISSLVGSLMIWPLTLIKWSSAMVFIHEYYTYTIGAVVTLIVYCLVFKKNRFILRSFLPKGMGKNHKILVVEDTYEPTQNNTAGTLLFGLLLGFIANFACIACALINGNIKLHFNFSVSMIPVLIFGFLMVFVQSSSEEMWCRGFMYERINIHYPLWVSVFVNGVFFGLLHCFNDGATVLAIADIMICGFSYSLLRWYTGSIWMVMGLHAMWNFTQNFLFGLPNSGLVSEVSVMHLDAATGNPSLIYDYVFGVEGALPALIIDTLIGVVVLILAKRDGRLGELLMSYEKTAALKAEASEDNQSAAEPEVKPAEENTIEAESEVKPDEESVIESESEIKPAEEK